MSKSFNELSSEERIQWIAEQFWKGLVNDGTSGVCGAASDIYNVVSRDRYNEGIKAGEKLVTEKLRQYIPEHVKWFLDKQR